ncbi:hypothetical protein M407DRAFT_21644 [Tulasnella calospora MUT 4182]|uniref:Cytochrome c oxidase assembly protein COX20, mitochondrial n=1 Tax=Tulasnella calospora MUT 4182 TaxID=1051891 RepID=A0A0C3QMU0_9AGAM|nr:hypothetical protein M407DRAFT_21644 [Tulasnella calospora MUT 4182]
MSSSPAPSSPDSLLDNLAKTAEDASGKPNSSIPSNPSLQDYSKALKQVSVVDDFKRLPEIPCARNSLMYGIASGAGIGALRYLNAGPKAAANWAMGAFVFISCTSWAVCRRERGQELEVMQTMQRQYPERHARAAKEKALARQTELEAASNSGSTSQ